MSETRDCPRPDIPKCSSSEENPVGATHPESERAVALHAVALLRLRQPLEAVQELELFLKTKPESLVVLL